MLRSLLIWASTSASLRRLVTRQGWARREALRFVAGETLEEGLAAARELVAADRMVTLDYLGEAVTDPDQARAAADIVITAIERLAAEGLPAEVSIKPTQLGLSLPGDPQGVLCRELVGAIAKAADAAGTGLTLDMEGSDVTEATVALTEDLITAGHRNVGCAVQSYLHRTYADIVRLSAIGASLRLTKGAYQEPPEIAYQSARQVDTAFDECLAYLLEHGTYPRIATHDHRLVLRTQRHAERLGVGRDRYEFQMLYGVRRPLQARLVRDGYRLRVYVPFGDQWYPYFLRRLAERPANLVFFLRALRG
jgi:proline dehydrogenase